MRICWHVNAVTGQQGDVRECRTLNNSAMQGEILTWYCELAPPAVGVHSILPRPGLRWPVQHACHSSAVLLWGGSIAAKQQFAEQLGRLVNLIRCKSMLASGKHAARENVLADAKPSPGLCWSHPPSPQSQSLATHYCRGCARCGHCAHLQSAKTCPPFPALHYACMCVPKATICMQACSSADLKQLRSNRYVAHIMLYSWTLSMDRSSRQ